MTSFDPSAPRPGQEPPGVPLQEEEQSALSVILGLLQVLVMAVLAAFASYLSFIVAGAILDQFLDGPLKMAGACVLALVIPMFTAAGDNSRQEGSRRMVRLEERLSRFFIGVAIIGFATAILISLAMAGNVCGQLRNNPNWFLPKPNLAFERPSPLHDRNRHASWLVADLVEAAARKVGLYEDQPHRMD